HAPALYSLQHDVRTDERTEEESAKREMRLYPCQHELDLGREDDADHHGGADPQRGTRSGGSGERADGHAKRARNGRRDGREAGDELRHDHREESPPLEDALGLTNARIRGERNAAEE